MTREQGERLETFWREYQELAKRHKVYIVSCGCCGGPGFCDAMEDEGPGEMEEYLREMAHSRWW